MYNHQLTDLSKWRPKEKVYIALESLDFSWYPDEVRLIKKLWTSGLHLSDMAQRVRRDPDEIAILLMDLVRCGKIKARPGGVFGRR